MFAKKRAAKFVAPQDDAEDASSSDDSSAGSDDNDFAFYQSRFPLPTAAPKPARPARRPTASPSSGPPQPPRSEQQWVEVHDARRDKYQQRRSAREAELAALAAEAEDNRRNEFSALPRFVPYVRDAAGKWLGGKSVHRAKPKQLGVIEDYVVPEAGTGKRPIKKRGADPLGGGGGGGGGGGRDWGCQADMVDAIAGWIERQPGEEVMTVAQIGERVQARVGDSWNRRFRPRYGSLLEWLKSKPQFAVDADRVTVRPREEAAAETSETHQTRQQRERREADARSEAAAQVVSGAERSWLAFALYAVALLAVGYGAYTVWSGRSMGDLARQLSQQLEAMEAKVADVKHAVEHTT